MNKPVVVAPKISPRRSRRRAVTPAARGAGDRAGLSGARRHQLLAFPQRHHAVADPVGVSDPEGELRARFRPDRADHAGVPVHRLAAAAGGRPLHRQEGAAVLAGDRHGLDAVRPAAAQRSRITTRHPDRRRAGRARLGGVSSGIGADRAARLGRPLRHGAIGVPGRRQCRHRARPGAGGADRGAVRPAVDRLVLLDRLRRDPGAVADRALVPAADRRKKKLARRSRIRTRRARGG